MIKPIKDIEEIKALLSSNPNLHSDMNMETDKVSTENGYKLFLVDLSKDDDHVLFMNTTGSAGKDIFTILHPKLKENLKTVCIPIFKNKDDYDYLLGDLTCHIFNGYMNVIVPDDFIDPFYILVVQDAFYSSRNNALQKLMNLTLE